MEMGKEIERVAKAEHRTVSELIRETFRQYQALHNLKELSKAGKKAARVKRITSKDFGGPFED